MSTTTAKNISPGNKAPAFSLPDQDGTPTKLSDLAGQWIVLYFYPRDNTPGCTREACGFSGELAAFQKLDAVVLGCSPDSPESHRKFIAKQNLKLRLLSDPEHAVLEQYGAWGEKNLYGKKSMGVIRSTVIIDPAGKIAWHWPKVSVDGHVAAVRTKLAELRG